MTDADALCQLPNCTEKILAASHCGVAYLGGSITVGVGASDVSRTSWRALLTEHVYQAYHPKYHNQASEIMGAVGACESYVAAFTIERNVLPALPDLAIIEFAVNDRGAPDEALVIKGMEGMVRRLRSMKSPCDVIILGAGAREHNVDHTRHRRVADHYGVPFVDLQTYLFDRLREQGRTWDDISIEFEQGDSVHLNDLGNRYCFEAIRDCFDEHMRRYQAGRRPPRHAPLPPPLVSDELAYTTLIDPTRKSRSLVVEGEWVNRPRGQVPWYFDNLMAGRPGARMTLRFTGTAVALFGLMYNNGLKVEAEVDGKPVPGAYLKHFIEFGKGTVLAHGLPHGEHELRLTVADASLRHNKLENPTAQVAYIGVACRPEAG
jgi:lysophospholipase L1-like esterase